MFDFKLNLSQAAEYAIISLLGNTLHQGENIMSVISDFVAQQNAYNDQMDAAIAGLTEDVKGLAAHVAALQNTPTPLSADDVGLLSALATRTKGIADKLAALDAVTAPVAPVEVVVTPPAPVVAVPPTDAGTVVSNGPPVTPAAQDSTTSPSGNTGTAAAVSGMPPTTTP